MSRNNHVRCVGKNDLDWQIILNMLADMHARSHDNYGNTHDNKNARTLQCLDIINMAICMLKFYRRSLTRERLR